MTQITESPGAEVAAVSEAGLAPSMADVLIDAEPRKQSAWGPIGFYLVTILVLVTFNFALPRLMPGDPIDGLMVLGSPTYVDDDETRSALAGYYGLDEPLHAQYISYLGSLAQGDLGTSITSNAPVSTELGGRAGWSFLLVVASLLVSLVISIPLGVHSGWKRGKGVDRGLLAFFLAFQNLPIFVVGAAAFVVFAAQFDLFPLRGATTDFADYSGLTQVVDVLHHLALPALLMGIDFATYGYLVLRSSMVSELGSDYLLGGRAKGLRERRLKYHSAGRNALLPFVTVIGLQFSVAATGLIFVEQIFSYPGVGQYMLESIGTRDYPAMQGAFLLLTLTVVTSNLVVDVLYRRLDPRTVPA